MSSITEWTYTEPCTVWRKTEADKYGKPTFSAPEIILCDYGFNSDVKTDAKGNEINQKNTFWTEFPGAGIGDYILLGESALANPIEAGADEILNKINYGNTLDRDELPDFALVT